MKGFLPKGLIAPAGALLLSLAACNRAPLDVAPNVDLDQFQGKWHEVAYLPRATESDCTGTTATYTKQADGTLAVVHECTLKTGEYRGATAVATVVDPKNPAKMEIDFGGHRGDYWVIEVGTDYRYAVIGHPSRDYLWILSRDEAIDAKDLDLALSHAKDKGFDTTHLLYTPPGPDPQGTPAPPMSYGCSAAPRARSSGSVGALFVLALLFLRRRRGR